MSVQTENLQQSHFTFHVMTVLFNIVAVLVWQITSLARPRAWLTKDLTFKAKAKDSKFVHLKAKDQGHGQQQVSKRGMSRDHWNIWHTIGLIKFVLCVDVMMSFRVWLSVEICRLGLHFTSETAWLTSSHLQDEIRRWVGLSLYLPKGIF